MKKYYQVTLIKYEVIEIDDALMKKYGYEGEITEEDRQELLKNLIAEKPYNYDDIDIQETHP